MSRSSKTKIQFIDEVDTEASPLSRSPKKRLTTMNSRGSLDVGLYSPKFSPKSPGTQLFSIHEKSFGGRLSPIIESKNEVGHGKPLKSAKNLKEILESKNGTMSEVSIKKKVKDQMDYSSLLMYIPDMNTFAVGSDRSFNSFTDLVQTNKRRRSLKKILKESSEESLLPTNNNSSTDKIELMRKVLEFNKVQKKHYVEQAHANKKNILLPLIKQTHDNAKKTPHVKVLPSRKMYESASGPDLYKEDTIVLKQTETNSPSIQHYKSSPNSPTFSNNKRESRRSFSQRSNDEKFYEQSLNTKAYKVFWAYNPTGKTTWKPDVREGHTFTTVGKQVILYGGLNTSLLDELAVYEPVKGSWSKPKVTGDVPSLGRHGHTACEYKKNLIIFGGEQHFNPSLNMRECLNDVRTFNLEKNEWKYMKTSTPQIPPKRHHAATVNERNMFVYGGITSEGAYTRDLWSLNLKTYNWDHLEITDDKEPGIAFHTMCACFVDKSAPTNKDKEKLKTFEEGVYVFGGKTVEGKVLSTLKMFVVESKYPQWIYPTVKGTPPTARYNHSMVFYEPLASLVVYGGRNDGLYESTNDICLNDVKILNLEHMTWSSTTSYGDIPQVGRYTHGVASFGSKMLIFGGVEFHRYADDEVKSVELNQGAVRRIIDMDREGESGINRTKSVIEVLPPITKEKKKVAFGESKKVEENYPKNFVSWMPLPQNKMMGGNK